MGMAGSQCRLLQLTARLADLELQAQSVTNSKIRNAMNSQSLAEVYTAVLQSGTAEEIDNATVTFEAQNTVLAAQDKLFDMSLQNIDTEHTALQTEVESVKKVISKDIERTFKIFQA